MGGDGNCKLDGDSAALIPVPQLRAWRRAFAFGVLNGAAFQLGFSFSHPSTVLVTFATRLTNSELGAGLIGTIAGAGWFLPQLFVVSYIESQPYKMPIYRLASTLRLLSWAMMMLTTIAFFGASKMLTAICFFLFYAFFMLMGGVAGLAFMDIVTRTIPPRRRGAFWGARNLFGGLLGVLSGLIVREILAMERALPFPNNYMLLMLFSLISYAIAFSLFMVIDEPPDLLTQPRLKLIGELRDLFKLLRDNRQFRLLILTRLILDSSSIAGPFYATFAIRVLGAHDSVMGTFLILQTITGLLFTPFWSYINDAKGCATATRVCIFLLPIVPLMAFAISAVSVISGSGDWMLTAWMIIYALIGAISSGPGIAFTNYLLELAETERRPLLIASFNTIDGLVMFFPMLGGLIVHSIGYHAVFGFAAISALCAIVIAKGLFTHREP
ncbi:MAG: hypothetical protein RMK18_09325 [Armatimonadota bacterium]|nr:hypothetical protein [Armatimonadota bacterium]MCX7778464.1 hypothetical protein [Armatimonadota bacterium]MDW8026043.1 hypothetical protein [Armatimonadota bacterium]